MGNTRAETVAKATPAPRGRRALAATIDMALLGVPPVLYARSAQRAGDGRALGRFVGGRWNRVFNSARPVIDEQIGTPGAWIAGVRTVDSRTGRRVVLWRSLAIALARFAIGELQRRRLRVSPAIPQAEHAELARGLQAIKDAYPDDPNARERATMRVYEARKVKFEARKVKFGGWPMLAGLAATVLANQWLRRHLAPTVVVSSRGPAID